MKKFITVLLSTTMLLQIFVPLKVYAAVPPVSEQLPEILNNTDYFVKIDDNKYAPSDDVYIYEYVEESQCYNSYYDYFCYEDKDVGEVLFLGKAVLNIETGECVIYYNYGNGWKPTDIEFQPDEYYYGDDTYKNELGETYTIELLTMETNNGTPLSGCMYVGDYNSIVYGSYCFYEYDNINHKVYSCEYYFDDECENIEDAIKLDKTDATDEIIYEYGKVDFSSCYTYDSNTKTLTIHKNILAENDNSVWDFDISEVKNVIIEKDVTELAGIFNSVQLDKLIVYSDKLTLWDSFQGPVSIKHYEYKGSLDDLFINYEDMQSGNYNEDDYYNLPVPHKFYDNTNLTSMLYYSKLCGPNPYYDIDFTVEVGDWFKYKDLLGSNYLVAPATSSLNAYLMANSFITEYDTYSSSDSMEDPNVLYGINLTLPKDDYQSGDIIKRDDMELDLLSLGSGYQNGYYYQDDENGYSHRTNHTIDYGSYWDYSTNSWKWVGEDSDAVESDLEPTVRRWCGDKYYVYNGIYYPAQSTWKFDDEKNCFAKYNSYYDEYSYAYIGKIEDGTVKYTNDNVTWYDTTFTTVNEAQDNEVYGVNGNILPIYVLDESWEKVNDMYCSYKVYYEDGHIYYERISNVEYYATDLDGLEVDTFHMYSLAYDDTGNSGYKYWYLWRDEINRIIHRNWEGCTYNGQFTETYYYKYTDDNDVFHNYVWVGKIVDGKVWYTWNGQDWYETSYTSAEEALNNDVSQRYTDNAGHYRQIHVLDFDFKVLPDGDIIWDYIFMDPNGEYFFASKDGTVYNEYEYFKSDMIYEDNLYYYKYGGKVVVNSKYPTRYTNTGYEYTENNIDWKPIESVSTITTGTGINDIIDSSLYDMDYITGKVVNNEYYKYGYKEMNGGFYKIYLDSNNDKVVLPKICGDMGQSYNIGLAYEEDGIYYLHETATPVYRNSTMTCYKIDAEGYYNILEYLNYEYTWTKTDYTTYEEFISAYPKYVNDITVSKCVNVNDMMFVYYVDAVTYDEDSKEWYNYNIENGELTPLDRYYTLYTREAYLPIEVSELTSATWNGRDWNLQDDLVVQDGANTLSLEYHGLVYNLVIGEDDIQNPSNGNIEFKADINSWFEVKVPNEHSIDKTETDINIPLAGDLKGNQNMILSCTPTTVLTDGVTIINAMCSLGKTKYSYDDLLSSPNAKVNVIVDKLPAGRYVGQIQLTVGIENNT